MTTARLYWGLKPINLPIRRFLRGWTVVLTLTTLTANKSSIAALICGLVDFNSYIADIGEV